MQSSGKGDCLVEEDSMSQKGCQPRHRVVVGTHNISKAEERFSSVLYCCTS